MSDCRRAGRPGSYGHVCEDAKTFAEWGVDWLKEDHCALPALPKNETNGQFFLSALTEMSHCLNGTKRPIFFDICAHGCYQSLHNATCWKDWYTNAAQIGNGWRTTTDI
jgi:alpha-galactosidase